MDNGNSSTTTTTQVPEPQEEEEEEEALMTVLVEDPPKSVTPDPVSISMSISENDGVSEPLIPLPLLERSILIFDDYIRFDILRRGALCCTGYTISVQYDDDFLIGRSRTSADGNPGNVMECSSCFISSFCCLASSLPFPFRSSARRKKLMYFHHQLSHPRHKSQYQHQQSSLKKDERDNTGTEFIFSVEYSTRFTCCFKSNRRKFTVRSPLASSAVPTKNDKSPSPKEEELGFIHINSINSSGDCPIIEIINVDEKNNFRARKIRTNSFIIETPEKTKVGGIDIFRGLRGGISSYGVSIVDDDITPVSKALFIASVIAMDIEERESETKCTFFWTPLLSSVVILLFTILPWMYYHKNWFSSTPSLELETSTLTLPTLL